MGSGAKLPVRAIGTMRLKVDTIRQEKRKKKIRFVNGTETMNLTNVLVVEGMPCKLFSTRYAFEHDGITTHLNGDKHLVLPSGSKLPFKDTSNHYVVAGALSAGTTEDDADLIHARLGHYSVTRINKSLGHSIDPKHCEACALNANRKPRPKQASEPTTYTYFGQRIATDTAGPFPASPQGYTHAINFVDMYSKYSATYFLKNQDSSSVLLAVQTFVADHKHWLLNTTIPGAVDEWFTDNGTEFMSDDIDTFCTELGTRRSMSVPYVPQRNGSAERLWGILWRPMRAMLAHSGGRDSIKETLWPFLMSQATLIHNSLKTRSHNHEYAPLELLQAGPIKLDKFRVMLCDCYVSLSPDERVDKLANRRIKAIHLGWDSRRRGYFVLIPELKRITTVVDIDFEEHSFSTLGQLLPTVRRPEQRDLPVPTRRGTLPQPPQPVAQSPPVAPTPEPPTVRLVMSRGGAPAEAAPADDTRVASDSLLDPFDDVSSALHADGARYHTPFSTASVGEVFLTEDPSASGPIPIPRSIKEALADPIYGSRWRDACLDELKGKFEVNKAWELVKDIPIDRKLMKGRWVLTIQYHDNGSIKRFKAHG